MTTLDAVAAVLAVAVPAAVVLRDVAAADRRPSGAGAALAEPAWTEAGERAAPVAATAETHDHGSVLARLTTTEADERSPVRRVGALAVLVTLTLLTSVVAYALIYRAVSGLG